MCICKSKSNVNKNINKEKIIYIWNIYLCKILSIGLINKTLHYISINEVRGWWSHIH